MQTIAAEESSHSPGLQLESAVTKKVCRWSNQKELRGGLEKGGDVLKYCKQLFYYLQNKISPMTHSKYGFSSSSSQS